MFSEMMQNHVEQEHGFIGSQNIENNLVRKDYSNLQTPWINGKYSLLVSNENGKGIGWRWRRTKSSNGIMEYGITYGFEVKANNQDGEYQIKDKMYFLQKSSVWDESYSTTCAMGQMCSSRRLNFQNHSPILSIACSSTHMGMETSCLGTTSSIWRTRNLQHWTWWCPDPC